MVYLERLLQFSNDFESNELAFEVFMRRKKFLLVVKSLYKLLKINPKNSNIKQLFERLIKEVSNPETQEKMNTVVRDVTLNEIEELKKLII